MSFLYVCSECSSIYDINPEIMVCPKCSKNQKEDEPIRGILEVELDIDINGNKFDIFDLFPVEKHFFPSIPVGNTPLWKPKNLEEKFGFKNLYIKDDGVNPTYSFKDRASFLVSAFANKYKVDEITLASTGNAGSSMAGIGAAAGQKITIFLPKNAPQAKIVQALQYGANVYKVDGNYDLAYDFSLEYSKVKGGMNRNTAYNPMTIEGKKSVSIEIFKDLKKAPDYVFVSTGDGCIVAGVLKGFKDLFKLGLIDKVPTVYSVQAKTSDALYRANLKGYFENIPTNTVADSICVDIPRNGYHALKLLKDFSGKIIRVSDNDIIKAQNILASMTGLFTEPAGATAYAGFLSERNNLNTDSTIVILATGNGLKDVSTALKGIQEPPIIKNLDEIV